MGRHTDGLLDLLLGSARFLGFHRSTSDGPSVGSFRWDYSSTGGLVFPRSLRPNLDLGSGVWSRIRQARRKEIGESIAETRPIPQWGEIFDPAITIHNAEAEMLEQIPAQAARISANSVLPIAGNRSREQ